MQNPGGNKKVGDKPKSVGSDKKVTPISDRPKQEDKTRQDKK